MAQFMPLGSRRGTFGRVMESESVTAAAIVPGPITYNGYGVDNMYLALAAI
jgi:hypothetical protein